MKLRGGISTVARLAQRILWLVVCTVVWQRLSLFALLLQSSSGVSRDEVAAALIEIAEGRIPKDRVALRELHAEMLEWPFLDAEEEIAPEGAGADYGGITNTGVPHT